MTDYVVSKPIGDANTKAALKTFLASVGTPGILKEVSGAYPTPGTNLQGYTGTVIFAGPDTPTSGGTTARTDNKAVAGLDWWFHTP